ncbi:MAG TPA: SAM-dependent DNA methyltransferase, partial [Thermoplasmatales archaeon]|nr:SAM-dependent DNA methyltransferase [Thermoplasmatales archaeon]
MVEVLTERSLYKPVSKILEKYDFKNIQEVRSGKGYIDIECFYDSYKIIVEIKIEDPRTKWKNLLDGVAQAYSYSKSTNASGFIVLEYPSTVRRPLEITPEIVEQIVSTIPMNAIVLTDFWTNRFIGKKQITTPNLIRRCREKIDVFITQEERDISFDFVIETIRESVNAISGMLRKVSGEKLGDVLNTVVGRFDLFLSLGEQKKEDIEGLRLAAVDLASYLLVNQILFYHVYSILTKKIDDLDEEKIKSVFDLKRELKKITDINYRAIYSIDVVSSLPDIELITEHIRKLIQAIKGIRAAFIKHDLLGRVYHELLPYETKKKLAAFYTKPIAAEILTGLTIDKWNEKVIDPACGSGTLLVSAYRRKFQL